MVVVATDISVQSTLIHIQPEEFPGMPAKHANLPPERMEDTNHAFRAQHNTKCLVRGIGHSTLCWVELASIAGMLACKMSHVLRFQAIYQSLYIH